MPALRRIFPGVTDKKVFFFFSPTHPYLGKQLIGAWCMDYPSSFLIDKFLPSLSIHMLPIHVGTKTLERRAGPRPVQLHISASLVTRDWMIHQAKHRSPAACGSPDVLWSTGHPDFWTVLALVLERQGTTSQISKVWHRQWPELHHELF